MIVLIHCYYFLFIPSGNTDRIIQFNEKAESDEASGFNLKTNTYTLVTNQFCRITLITKH